MNRTWIFLPNKIISLTFAFGEQQLLLSCETLYSSSMNDHIYHCDIRHWTGFEGKAKVVSDVQPLHMPLQYSKGDEFASLKLLCDLSVSKPVIDPILDMSARHGICFTQNAILVLQLIVHICMYSYMPPTAYTQFIKQLVQEVNHNIRNPGIMTNGITYRKQQSFQWIVVHTAFIWPLFINMFFTRSFKTTKS
jgi:hypothetical protein